MFNIHLTGLFDFAAVNFLITYLILCFSTATSTQMLCTVFSVFPPQTCHNNINTVQVTLSLRGLKL